MGIVHGQKGKLIMKNISITHTEILCLAIRCIDADINAWRDKIPDTPAGFIMFCKITEESRAKRDHLLKLYEIETGTAYE